MTSKTDLEDWFAAQLDSAGIESISRSIGSRNSGVLTQAART